MAIGSQEPTQEQLLQMRRGILDESAWLSENLIMPKLPERTHTAVHPVGWFSRLLWRFIRWKVTTPKTITWTRQP